MNTEGNNIMGQYSQLNWNTMLDQKAKIKDYEDRADPSRFGPIMKREKRLLKRIINQDIDMDKV